MNKKTASFITVMIISAIALFVVLTFIRPNITDYRAKTTMPVPIPTSFAADKIHAGDTIFLGKYEQDAYSSNGPEDIEWIVLAVSEGRALVISRYGLDARPYHTEVKPVTWETCSLRAWLNTDFFQIAFSSGEQSAIMLMEVDNSNVQGYSGWSTSGGNSTQDRIFLLSFAEANRYLNVSYSDSNTVSRISPTAYAIQQGAYTSSDYKTEEGSAAGWWWLRSPGGFQNGAARVYRDGSLNSGNVDRGSGCIRPALWIDLRSDLF